MFSDALFIRPDRWRQYRLPPLGPTGHYNAFNNSIVKGKNPGEWITVFRYSNFSPNEDKVFPDLPAFSSRIGVAVIDSTLEVVGEPFVIEALDMPADPVNVFSGYEDPRIFIYRDTCYLLCNRFFADGVINKMFLVELTDDFDVASVRPLVPPLPPRSEKNWVALPADDRLYIKYSLEPNIVLALDPRDGTLETVHAEPAAAGADFTRDGFLSGGSALMPFNEHEYLGIAHVARFQAVDQSDPYFDPARRIAALDPAKLEAQFRSGRIRNYYSVFYTVSRQCPFRLLRRSGPVKFVRPDGCYEDIQYAAGLCFGDSPQRLWISYGSNDAAMNVIEMTAETVNALLDGSRAGEDARPGYGAAAVCNG